MKIIGTNLSDVSHLYAILYGKPHEMNSRTTPDNDSAPFRFNNFPILLLERQKSITSMISGLLDPLGTLIYGFEYDKLFVVLRKHGEMSQHDCF